MFKKIRAFPVVLLLTVSFVLFSLTESETGKADAATESYQLVTKWGSNGSGDGQFTYPRGIAVDASGNIYVCDSYNNRVQKFNSSGTFITKWGSFSTTLDGKFNYPNGIAVDSSGNVYVADGSNHRIQKFDSSGTFITKWGSSGSGDGQFSFPNGVVVDSSGNVYVADSTNNRVQKFDSNGTFITKWGSTGSGDGQFYYTRGIAVDASGYVYVSDQNNHRIQKFDSSGAFKTKWGSSGTADGQFNRPLGVAVDASGNVFVADEYNNRIQKFDSSGTFITKWGSNGSGDSQFIYPWGTAVDASGNVYVDDTYNHRIQKFSLAASGSAPTVTTGSATNVTSNNAKLNGTVNANGLSTNVWFDYGIASGSYSNTSATVAVSGSSAASVGIDISGLSAGTPYYYRIAAQNSAGTSYGSENSFTTSALPTTTTSTTTSTTTTTGASSTTSTIPSTTTTTSTSTTSTTILATTTSTTTTSSTTTSSTTTSSTTTTTLSGSTPTPIPTPAGGIVAYYPFNGNANDESVNGNNGTAYGATLTTDRLGNANKAYSFDGADDYIEVSDSSSLDIANAITIVAWVYINKFDTNMQVLQKDSNIDHHAYALPILSNYGESYSGCCNPRRFGLELLLDGKFKSGMWSNDELNENTWYFLATTYNGSEVKLYLNGQNDSVFVVSGTIETNNNPVRIGNFRGQSRDFLNGLIDEVRIYNRALSDAEILELYKEGGSTTPTPTPSAPPTLLPIPTPTLGPIPTLPPLPTPPPVPTSSPISEGIIYGFVNDEEDNSLENVTVNIQGDNFSDDTETDEYGYYEFAGLEAGAYSLTYEKEGYETQTIEVNLDEEEILPVEDVVMEEVVMGRIYGFVVNIKDDPIENVRLRLKGLMTGKSKKTASDADGYYEFADLEADTYVIFAKKKGYKRNKKTVRLGDGESEEIELVMRKTTKKIIAKEMRGEMNSK